MLHSVWPDETVKGEAKAAFAARVDMAAET
jgi:hypothetical protein